MARLPRRAGDRSRREEAKADAEDEAEEEAAEDRHHDHDDNDYDDDDSGAVGARPRQRTGGGGLGKPEGSPNELRSASWIASARSAGIRVGRSVCASTHACDVQPSAIASPSRAIA